MTATAAFVAAKIGPDRAWKGGLVSAANWMLALGAVAVVATIAAGFQAYYSVGHDGPSHAAMTVHRNWAVPSGLAILVLAGWRWKSKENLPSGLFVTLLTASALALTVTAWWGGKIVYGYGLGVKSLPQITGDGHDHDHGDAASHVHAGKPDEKPTSHDHDEGSGGHDHDGATDAQAVDPGAISSVFNTALRTGDVAHVSGLLADDVLIIEGGHAQTSKAEYMGGHMKSDMAFVPHMETEVLSREAGSAGDRAWVVTHTRSIGSYKDKAYDQIGREFMLLKRTDDQWKIALIEWADR